MPPPLAWIGLKRPIVACTCRCMFNGNRHSILYLFGLVLHQITCLRSYQTFIHSFVNPIQAGGALCAPSPKSQHIFKTAWSLELLFCDFSFYVFSIQKSSVPPISPNVCCHGNHATFWLIFENSNRHCFSRISIREKLSVG